MPKKTIHDRAQRARNPIVSRKLLVASIGVASVSFVACEKHPAAGNLAVAPPMDAQVAPATPATIDGGAPAASVKDGGSK